MSEKTKIVMVDDEEDFSHFIKLNLESTSRFEVFTSVEGEEGIQLAKSKKPDLILLDIFMPGMDGTTVAERLMEEPVTKDIPIIFLTALATKQDVTKNRGMVGGDI